MPCPRGSVAITTSQRFGLNPTVTVPTTIATTPSSLSNADSLDGLGVVAIDAGSRVLAVLGIREVEPAARVPQ